MDWILCKQRSTKPTVGCSNHPGRARNPLGVSGSSPQRGREQRGRVMSEIVASRIDWLFAPEWVTFGVACFLSGWDADSMREIIREGGVDVNTED